MSALFGAESVSFPSELFRSKAIKLAHAHIVCVYIPRRDDRLHFVAAFVCVPRCDKSVSKNASETHVLMMLAAREHRPSDKYALARVDGAAFSGRECRWGVNTHKSTCWLVLAREYYSLRSQRECVVLLRTTRQ